MTSPLDLLKAIRSGRLQDVRAVFESGVTLETESGQGEPGLPMGIACFLGHVDIVRELVGRGAKVNLPDNAQPTSPLSMAVRGGRTEVVRALLELGAILPEGMQTGLSEREVTVAQWIAFRDGHVNESGQTAEQVPVVEEIQVGRLSNVDTQVLEAEMLRAAMNKL